jgi:hypothetical protein
VTHVANALVSSLYEKNWGGIIVVCGKMGGNPSSVDVQIHRHLFLLGAALKVPRHLARRGPA